MYTKHNNLDKTSNFRVQLTRHPLSVRRGSIQAIRFTQTGNKSTDEAIMLPPGASCQLATVYRFLSLPVSAFVSFIIERGSCHCFLFCFIFDVVSVSVNW